MSNHRPQYLLLLGSTPELSWWELTQTIPKQCHLQRVNQRVAGLSSLPKGFSAPEMLQVLGGTIKIARVFAYLDVSDNQEVLAKLQSYISDTIHGRIEFALGEWGRDHLPKLDPADLKDLLTKTGKSVRFRTGHREGISAAISLHQSKVVEYIVSATKQGTILAQTVAIQNIDEWQARDRGKPFAEHKRGLLPPKVARMMVVGALGNNVFSQSPIDATLWDPFCGAGTILYEAWSLGVKQIFGSDHDPKSVEGCNRNTSWFEQHFSSLPSSKLHFFEADATRVVDPPFQAGSVSHLVTEPFLGKPKPTASQISNIQKGLLKLYKGAFKEWRQWLQPNATVVCIFPRWAPTSAVHHREITLHGLIDFLETIGYTTTSEPIVYARPHAIVQREIWHFRYQP